MVGVGEGRTCGAWVVVEGGGGGEEALDDLEVRIWDFWFCSLLAQVMA